MPNWTRMEEERRRQALARSHGDAMKEVMLRVNPKVRFWSIYGTVVIKGRREKFSFDVAWDEKDYSRKQMYLEKKWVYDRLYRGLIPENYYYQFFVDPAFLHKARWVEHEGLSTITQVSKRKGVRGKYESWRPRARYYKKEKEEASRVAGQLRLQERKAYLRRTRQYR